MSKLSSKKIILIVALLAGMSLFLYQNGLTPFIGDPQNETGLRNRYETWASDIKAGNYEGIYDSILLESEKEKPRDEYVAENKEDLNALLKKVKSIDIILNGISISGNVGYTDITSVLCNNEKCDKNRTRRFYRKWVYVGGHWYITNKLPLCIRERSYDNPPEFERSYDLIIQRLEQISSVDSTAKEGAGDLRNIKNCVNIQYAITDSEMNGAEGFFSFGGSDSLEDLKITVSPRYSVKDDLITATLLMHELTHVLQYVQNTKSTENSYCYKHEAEAFQKQNYFLDILNQEERDSINARVLYGGSQELSSLIYIYSTIPSYPGEDYSDKALNFVKSNSYYQRQCSN